MLEIVAFIRTLCGQTFGGEGATSSSKSFRVFLTHRIQMAPLALAKEILADFRR